MLAQFQSELALSSLDGVDKVQTATLCVVNVFAQLDGAIGIFTVSAALEAASVNSLQVKCTIYDIKQMHSLAAV